MMLLLVKTQESELKKSVDIWSYLVTSVKEQKKCRSIIFLFGQLNLLASESMVPLMNERDYAKKRKALDRIFVAAHHNLRDAFHMWRNRN